MQLPRRTRGSRFALSTIATIAGAGMLTLTPAAAAPTPTVASDSDAFVKAQCGFKVTSVATVDSHTVIHGRLTGKSGPVNFTAARNIAHNSVVCMLRPGNGGEDLAVAQGGRNGAYAYANKSVAVSNHGSFMVCVKTFYVLKNGTSTSVGITCYPELPPPPG
jgi:hypothetical protein